MRTKRAFIALGMASTALASAQFTNGNFEAGSLAGWTVTNTASGTTAIQDAFQYDIDGPGALGTSFVGRFSAGRTIAGSVNEGILLTQNLNLSAGVQYTFDFDWSAYRVPVTTGANTQGGIFSLVVNGTALVTQAAGSTSGAAPKFGHITGSFTPTATGSYAVGASILRPFTIPTPTAPTLFQAVDNFTMSAVPEPATMAALGLGVAALLRRRRK
jgi:hypothetical protein